ncbi:MAG TPA: FAD/NAD(P)-binding oxidoreductase [Longimicrobiales bacterium]|nr:FAD/NAD(P)-binding oxidoreductase [Longimicrobiales bacterium]
MSRHYVLIGSGIAALSAAESVRAADAAGKITLISEERHPFYSRPGLAYLLDGTVPEDQLWIRSAAHERELDLDRWYGSAVELDAHEHLLSLRNGSRLRFDRLLIATGAASIPPAFPGAGLDGVVQLDGLDGARAIMRRARHGLFREARAVVVGGGSTALEIVEGLHHRGVETHYLLRGTRYWSRVLDPVESQIVEDQLHGSGIRLHRRAEIARADGRNGKLQAVITRTGERIACDILAVAIGVRPRLPFTAHELQTDAGVVTDEQMRTSVPDVFAAGDVAQVRSASNGAGSLDTLWQSAVHQGRTAGFNMAGASVPYRPHIALNVTRLAGITTTIMGAIDGGDQDPDLLTVTRGQSERWRADPSDWTVRARRGGDRVRLLVGRQYVTGAIIMGDQTPGVPLGELIDGQVDISPIREHLEEHPDKAVSILIDFHRAWHRNRRERAH